MEKLTFTTENEEPVEFFVLEQTRVQGISYLLVTEDEEEGECYILKDLSAPGDLEADYEFVEDEQELEALSKVFTELMEDVDIRM